MKKLLPIILVLAIGVVIAGWVMSRRQAVMFAQAQAEKQAAAQAEIDRLEAELKHAKGQRASSVSNLPPTPQVVEVEKKSNPAEILDRLLKLSTQTTANQNRNMRLIVHEFESLIEAGPDALPTIREFLARNIEVDYEAGWNVVGKRPRDGKITTEFMLPPSLRLGLFEAAKLIGGLAAEKILADTMSVTGRGVEVAYLARALEEMAPGKYRETALNTARDLLNQPLNNDTSHAADKNDRNYLFGVLAFFNDSSFTGRAQAQLVQADGQVDRAALKYLQQITGTQVVSIVAQAYQDARITDPGAKEPLARAALNFVGTDNQANEFYKQTINDPNLPQEVRKNLIEDLNEGGLSNAKNLTANDLPLILNRLSLIEQLAPNAMDQINANAFKEAYKDLTHMRDALNAKLTVGK